MPTWPLVQHGSPAGDRALSPLLSGVVPQFPLFRARVGMDLLWRGLVMLIATRLGLAMAT